MERADFPPMQAGFPDVKRIGTKLFSVAASDLDRDTARRTVDDRVAAGDYARYYPYRSKRDDSVRYVVYAAKPSRISASFCESDMMLRN